MRQSLYWRTAIPDARLQRSAKPGKPLSKAANFREGRPMISPAKAGHGDLFLPREAEHTL